MDTPKINDEYWYINTGKVVPLLLNITARTYNIAEKTAICTMYLCIFLAKNTNATIV